MEKSEAQNMGDFGPMTAAKILWKAMPDAEDDNSITKEERDENSFESSSSEEEQCNITTKKQFWRGNRWTTLINDAASRVREE